MHRINDVINCMPLVNELNDAGAIHRRLENLRIGFVMYAITLSCEDGIRFRYYTINYYVYHFIVTK